jgi:hypothetical protein
MANYTVELDYTSNTDKAAKLKISDAEGRILLKGDAVIPKSLHETDKFLPNLEVNKFLPEHYSVENIHADSQKIRQYERALGDTYLESSVSSLNILKRNSFYSNGGKKVSGIDEAITVSDETFDLLKALTSDPKNTVNLVASKNWFLFGQKPCERTYDVSFTDYKRLGEKIENEEFSIRLREDEARYAREEAARKAAADAKKTVSPKPVEPKPVSTAKPQAPKQAVPPKQTTQAPRNTAPRQSFSSNTYNRNYQNNTNYRNNDDLDAFDLMYMTAFPDMAPFYRPTSGLAWMMYFNNQHNRDELTTYPVECINKIPGFEDVNGCDLRVRGDNSYKVDMYSDEAKTNYLGTLNFSPEKGLSIKDENGNTTVVTEMKDKPGYNVLVESENSSKALIEVVQDKNNDLVGNWTIEPHNSIMMTSSMSIGQDLSLSSDTNKTINLDSVSTSDELKTDSFYRSEPISSMDMFKDLGQDKSPSMSSTPTPDFEPSPTFESKLDNKFDNDFKYEPPPPPPPPPEDSFNFTSQDPYSRTGYSM